MKPISLWIIVSAFISLMGNLSWAEQSGLTLTVKVSGGTPNKGQIIASLFTTPDNYLKAPASKQIEPVNGQGEASVRFDHLSAATYAVSVIYDEDTNDELNTGFLGIPTEQVGFSNNAKSRFGPPPFEKTAFKLAESQTVHIVLVGAKD